MALSPELQEVAERLLRSESPILELDAIAEALGTLAVSYDEIGALFDELERSGATIGNPDAGKASQHLARTLQVAHQLRRQWGRTPNAREIAEAAGLPVQEVRSALLFAQVLGR